MTQLRSVVSRPNVPPEGTTVKADITIQPGRQEEEVKRHIALCVDTSGSMTGEKMEQVKEGILWIFGYLEDDDYISIVSFDDQVEVVLEPSRWGDLSRKEAEELVRDMAASGGTDILEGLRTAHETLSSLPVGEDVGRRILLLSDGRDETPIGEFIALAQRIRREDHIAIPAAGIGDFYDEQIIRAVGTASEGEWIHLSRPQEIEDFFGRKVQNLSTVVAPNPHLELNVAQGVDVREAYLRKPQVQDLSFERHENTVRIFLPDLLEFEEQELVMELSVPRCRVGADVTLADAVLRSDREGGGGRTEITVHCTNDPDLLAEVNEQVEYRHTDTKVRKAASEGEFSRAETMLEQAADAHDDDDLDRMGTVIEEAREGDLEEKYMSTKIQEGR